MTCHGKLRTVMGACYRKATVVRDGQAFCWQHDPERLDRLAQEERQRQREERARKEAERDAAFARCQLMARSGIHGLSDADLQAIIDLGGIQAILARLLRKGT